MRGHARQTQKLLNYYGITTPTISMHEHNEAERTTELIAAMLSGSRIAVVLWTLGCRGSPIRGRT